MASDEEDVQLVVNDVSDDEEKEDPPPFPPRASIFSQHSPIASPLCPPGFVRQRHIAGGGGGGNQNRCRAPRMGTWKVVGGLEERVSVAGCASGWDALHHVLCVRCGLPYQVRW
jgi:hypothetical protein